MCGLYAKEREMIEVKFMHERISLGLHILVLCEKKGLAYKSICVFVGNIHWEHNMLWKRKTKFADDKVLKSVCRLIWLQPVAVMLHLKTRWKM